MSIITTNIITKKDVLNGFSKSCNKFNAHHSIYCLFMIIYSIQLSPIVSRVSMRTSTPSSHHSYSSRHGVMGDDCNNECGDDET